MSRIGKKPVIVPAGVTAKVDGQSILVENFPSPRPIT
jgi:ribosomal protein L6P/L9E